MKPTTRKIAGLLGASALILGAAACGSGGDKDSGADAGGSDDKGSGGKVVIYSNSVNDGRGEWLAEQAKEAGFDIQTVDLGGGDVMNRLISEKANPVADVTFGLNGVYYEKLKEADVLEAYEPSWADQVKDQPLDPDGLFWPIVREPIMLVYNTAVYTTPEEAPSDWPALWEEEKFHDLYEAKRSLGGATVQMVISGILTRYIDEDGHLGISQEGWDNIAEYYKYANFEEEGVDLYARMAEGIVNIGQMWLAGKVTREDQYGVVTEAVHPEIGVPMVTQSVALVKGAKHPEAAKEFIDWFGGAELQAAWSNEFGTAPTNVEAAANGDQAIIEYTDSFKAQDIDWAFVAEHIDSWVEEIELNYIK